MAYENLFRKGKIGCVELKNRVVMPGMGVNLAQPDGSINEHTIRYYEERAKGGVGLIVSEIARVDDVYGVGLANQMAASKIAYIPHYERLTDRVHKYGTKIFLQLHHPGRQCQSMLIDGRQIVAPSPVMCSVTKQMPRELTTAECEEIVKKFITGAVLAQKGGFDGVELHCAHGYLLNEFLSPNTNRRTDKYGGSFDNRLRIVSQIILGIRAMCGERFPISVRLSADEFVDGGMKLPDTVKIARALEALGVNSINVTCGTYESMPTAVEPASYPQGWKKYLAAEIRKNVKIPVIAVNNIKEPQIAEQLLEEGVCDFVGLARAVLADPEWVKKTKEGRVAEINRCIGCLRCFQAIAEGRHVRCSVNPRLGREVEYSELNRDGGGRPAAVIGGGPAGMQAALVLKERGYEPVIFERSAVLGGQINIADLPVHKEKMTAWKQSLIFCVEKAGIDVRLNTEADLAAVKALNPAKVIIAAGGSPVCPPIPGIDGKNVVSANSVLKREAAVGHRVIIIGGGVTGLETAETLAGEGHEVAVVEMAKAVGTELYSSVLYDLTARLQKLGVKVMTCKKLVKINESGVQLMDTVTGVSAELEADSVIIALGTRPNNELVEEFEREFADVAVVGDALKVGTIMTSCFDGYSRATVI